MVDSHIPIKIINVKNKCILEADWEDIVLPTNKHEFSFRLHGNYKHLTPVKSIWEFEVPNVITPFPKYGLVKSVDDVEDYIVVTYRIIDNNLDLMDEVARNG